MDTNQIPLDGTATSHESHLILGYTLIDHKLRTRLNLTNLEYVVFDYYYTHLFIEKKDLQDLEKEHLYRYTGLELNMFHTVFKRLFRKNVLEEGGLLSDKAEALVKYDNHFEEMWHLFRKRGTKKEARKMFDRAIRKVPARILHQAAMNYAELKKNEIDKYVMHLSSFLNPENEQYAQYIEIPKTQTPSPISDDTRAKW